MWPSLNLFYASTAGWCDPMEPTGTLAIPGITWKVAIWKAGVIPRRLELIDCERIPLERYLVFLGIDPETAREIVHDCFLKLHEHLLSGGDRTNLRAWLYCVAHNRCRNVQNAFRYRKTGSLDDLPPRTDLASPETSAEDDLLAKERTETVRRAIGQLTETQRECLILRSRGLKYREIAEAMGLSISSVGESVQRALDRLKGLV